MATYSKNSAYYNTSSTSTFLDVFSQRPFPFYKDDTVVVLEQQFEYRPDLFAYYLYKDAGLWWVFAQRNPNVLIDPIGDFVSGVSIRVPKLTTLTTALGL
jgi:hypothetical protein